jgi:transcriptional regulator with XRE-family HTH domain
MAGSQVEPPKDSSGFSEHATRQILHERFPDALRFLMDGRHLSYRQLAYMTRLSAGYLNHLTQGTRPVPNDPVIRTIAAALRVEPDCFLEYRQRRVVSRLEDSSRLIDALYSILLLRAPVSEEMKAILEKPVDDRPAAPQPPAEPADHD